MTINDTQVEAALERPLAARGSGMENRANGARLSALAASYTSALSRFHHDARLLPALQGLVEAMQKNQLPDGLYDSGNLDSPPDSAFILETLCQAQRQLVDDASPVTTDLRARLRTVILNTAEGVRTGGIHTPNHRWHVCAALRSLTCIGYIPTPNGWRELMIGSAKASTSTPTANTPSAARITPPRS